MRGDIDLARVLYGIGVLFGIAAVGYFARDLVFELSITVRALLLLLAFVGFLVVALAATRNMVVLGFSVLGAASYLAFLVYTITRFNVGADGTFLALAVSAGIFIAFGYLLRKRDVSPSPALARGLTLGLLLLATVFIGVDVAASGVSYDVAINDEASVSESGHIVVGTVTVTNQFLFREPIDAPQAYACIYVPGMGEYDRRPDSVQMRVGDRRIPDTIPGSASITASMNVRLSDEEAAAIDGPVPIERAAECPATSESARILLLFGGNRPIPPEP